MNILIKFVSYFAAYAVMTGFVALSLIVAIYGLIFVISFVAWSWPHLTPSWGLLRLLRISLVFGSIFGVWFIFDKTGKEMVADNEKIIRKWLKK